MCTTTSHWATHYSTECSKGGSGQCDGICVEHENECTCPCHRDWELPVTVAGVKDWHDEFWGILPLPPLVATDTSEWTLDDHLLWIQQEADRARFMNEVRLNVMLTTMGSRFGLSNVHSLDLYETTEKYRMKGAIK